MQTCLQCGSVFDSKTSGRRKFCGPGCMVKWHAQKANQDRKDARDLSGVCLTCGLQFVKTRQSQKYCSSKCRDTRWNAIRHPTTTYSRTCAICGAAFETVYRQQRLCQRCSKATRKGPARVEPKVRLSIWQKQKGLCYLCKGQLRLADAVVHHLDASGHRAKPDNRSENLVALHDRCHAMFHRVHLVYRDGKWGIDGRIFDYLQIESAVVMQTDRNAGS